MCWIHVRPHRTVLTRCWMPPRATQFGEHSWMPRVQEILHCCWPVTWTLFMLLRIPPGACCAWWCATWWQRACTPPRCQSSQLLMFCFVQENTAACFLVCCGGWRAHQQHHSDSACGAGCRRRHQRRSAGSDVTGWPQPVHCAALRLVGISNNGAQPSTAWRVTGCCCFAGAPSQR